MADDYAFGGSRNKKKDKFKERKKNPYKTGGKFRSSGVTDTKNLSSTVVKKKRKK